MPLWKRKKVGLIDLFETYMGHDYHWYLKTDLRTDLEKAYREPNSLAVREKLCKMLIIWALGASYSRYTQAYVPLVDSDHVSDSAPICAKCPGVEFFDQAMTFFKMPSEEPNIDHVEVLNLIAWYCFSMNRRKTAYMYAGLASRIARTLSLHTPTVESSRLRSEHKKRVLWTTYLIDWMTSLAIGQRPTLLLGEVEVETPCNDDLSEEEQLQFGNKEVLNMNIDLCRAQMQTATARLQPGNHAGLRNKIQPSIDFLQQWQAGVAQSCAFTSFDSGIPPDMLRKPEVRSISSIYLRYHQIFILLMRPVFLALLDHVFNGSISNDVIEDLIALARQCMSAARCNLRILESLNRVGKIARHGFWESLHLFSALKIFALGTLLSEIRPFETDSHADDDPTLALTSKALLQDMADSGNFAAKGHVKMLSDVEQVLQNATHGPDFSIGDYLHFDSFEDEIMLGSS
ncbi:hypothetical protein M409DRAFT_48953 [Zasmidium cellare ATCC 36951]|uniref:Xylanolytic transcriptional activator regulatory domain-containing protein n=1 Tax=Zasmidium cellare ATCC 36951 TaxID=1080233 RepID=A0A6A6D7C4_ZASCE|nr:uncharacterized protein M409DRAFT_48953 [Zasmidium cellare ATCC 36951]KAF2174069.1 hypothetical protein M409DRAFT_48953 [Zasmidium cellare ATCC 36951]